jgi:glycosyltransferase involved in cell wall biosynthesis
MRVSVILPVYNGQPFLAAAVDSILSQTFGWFELIAIDDGSTDDSLAVLQAFASTDPRVTIVSRPNRGLVATLNEGIALARGDYIARMDSDDIAAPDRFTVQVAYLDANQDVVALGGQILLIDEADRPLCPLSLPLDHKMIDGKHMTSLGSVLCHLAAMIRTQALRDVGGYDTSMEAAEDFDLWLRLAEIGRLANLPDTVLRYRQHLDSVGYAKKRLQRLSAWRAIKAASERRGLPFYFPSPEDEAPVTIADIYRKWGWWALGAGNVRTARHYALKALSSAPTSRPAWRLAMCALRGH